MIIPYSKSVKSIISTIMLACFFCITVKGQTYVDDMPSLEKIEKELVGADQNDSYAKQAAAMEILAQMINYNLLSEDVPNQQALMNSYHTTQEELKKQYLKNGGIVKDWHTSVGRYEVNKFFEKSVVYDLLGPLAKKKYDQIAEKKQGIEKGDQAREDAFQNRENAIQSSERKLAMTKWGITLGGFPVLFLGLWLFRRAYRSTLAAKEYEFNNTTEGGVVEFTSFQKAREHGLKKLETRGSVWLAAILITAGLAMIVGGCYFK